MELITLNKSACILASMHTDTGSTPESILYLGVLKMFKHVRISHHGGTFLYMIITLSALPWKQN
jgi:hypothetical protein